MASFRDLLKAAKSEITEVDTEGAAERIADGWAVLDVREPEEYDAGRPRRAPCTSRAATSRPQVESRCTDKATPVVVYCAGGVRSAFAATHPAASSATPTSCRWTAASAAGRTRAARGSSPSRSRRSSSNRYQRHLLLPEVGVEGQAKLLDAKVLLLGAGGLGSPAALYLAAAGVGTIGIVDMDEVDVSNLQRQILHNIDRIGDRKVDSAKKTITLINPDVERRHVRHAAVGRQHPRHHRAATTSSSTAPTTSPRATCSTTPA